VKSSFTIGVALVALILTPSARAQERSTFELVWERDSGAEACPVKEDFAASVKSRVGGDRLREGSASQLQVRLTRTPEKWRAEVRVLEAGSVKGSQQLEAEGADCAPLFNAVVAVAAVMLDSQPAQPVGREPIALEESKKKSPAPSAKPVPAVFPQPPQSEQEPADAPEDTLDKRWSLGIEVAQDIHILPDEKDICAPDGAFDCFEKDGSAFRGSPQPDTNDRVAAGMRFGSPRVLLGIQTLLGPQLGLELRAGLALGGGGLDNFSRWHIEIGARYWLVSPSSRFRPYVGTGIGSAEFATRIPITIAECGPGLTEAEMIACMQRRLEGSYKQLNAYQRLGRLFVPVRIGAAWSFSGAHSLVFGLAANVTFPSRGLVVQPSAGYSVAF
jgi:hypothetical protein